MFKILVAEDDCNNARQLKLVLKYAGYEVFPAADGKEALKILDTHHVDIILIGITMSRMSGYDLTEQIRSCGNNIPILMMIAKDIPEDRCKSFLAGADDCMTKPVNDAEMLLRIKALLRRSQSSNEQRLQFGDIKLDYNALTVSRSGEHKTLPPKEFYLIYKLLSYPDKIFTREQLMDEIWGIESNSLDTTINVHINRLRKRFEQWPEIKITAIRGIGYKAVVEI